MPTTIVKAWHSISGTVGATTLSTSQIASHYHTQSTEGYRHIGDKSVEQEAWVDSSNTATYFGSATYSTGGSSSHKHSISSVSTASMSSLPPYYSLSYIMHTA